MSYTWKKGDMWGDQWVKTNQLNNIVAVVDELYVAVLDCGDFSNEVLIAIKKVGSKECVNNYILKNNNGLEFNVISFKWPEELSVDDLNEVIKYPNRLIKKLYNIGKDLELTIKSNRNEEKIYV